MLIPHGKHGTHQAAFRQTECPDCSSKCPALIVKQLLRLFSVPPLFKNRLTAFCLDNFVETGELCSGILNLTNLKERLCQK